MDQKNAGYGQFLGSVIQMLSYLFMQESLYFKKVCNNEYFKNWQGLERVKNKAHTRYV